MSEPLTYTEFAALQGETIISPSPEAGDTEVVIETASGRRFLMCHDQDCCESVYLNDIAGEWEAIQNDGPVLLAEAVSNHDDPKPSYYSNSWTWTFYKLSTMHGSVTLRWVGESNGYYSESVNFFALSGQEGE